MGKRVMSVIYKQGVMTEYTQYRSWIQFLLRTFAVDNKQVIIVTEGYHRVLSRLWNILGGLITKSPNQAKA